MTYSVFHWVFHSGAWGLNPQNFSEIILSLSTSKMNGDVSTWPNFGGSRFDPQSLSCGSPSDFNCRDDVF